MAVSLKKGVYIVAGRRTPFGRFGGQLRDSAPEDLFAAAAQAAFKAGGIGPDSIDTVNVGQTCSLSNSGMSPRHAALKARVPQETPVLALNKASGSAFHAIVVSAQEILTGSAHISLTGGMENQSSIPFLIRDARFGIPFSSSIVLEDWLHSSNFDSYCSLPLAQTADILADMYKIRRNEVDEFALLSQNKWKDAHERGIFNEEVVPVNVNGSEQEQMMWKDECPRSDTTMASLSRLPPLFKGGVSTAGNICGNNDGAAALLVASEEALITHNLIPLSRLAGWASAGVDPALMGTAPVGAVNRLLAVTGLTIDDIDLIEIHETFAAQVLVCARELGVLVESDRLNVNGGAIAIGHPSGATGARLALHLTLELRRRKLKRGIATVCIAGGQGMALLLEAVL